MGKSAAAAKKARDKVRKHRAKLRKQGLRPVQIWVPDVRSAKFKAEARRESGTATTEKEEQGKS